MAQADCAQPCMSATRRALGRGVGLQTRTFGARRLDPLGRTRQHDGSAAPPATSAGMAASTVFQAPMRFTSTMSRKVRARLFGVGDADDAGVGDDDVEAAELAKPVGDTRIHRFGVTDVGLARHDPAALCSRPVSPSRPGPRRWHRDSRWTSKVSQTSMAMMSAPSPASLTACARPIPRAAPVMNATLPVEIAHVTRRLSGS